MYDTGQTRNQNLSAPRRAGPAQFGGLPQPSRFDVAVVPGVVGPTSVPPQLCAHVLAEMPHTESILCARLERSGVHKTDRCARAPVREHMNARTHARSPIANRYHAHFKASRAYTKTHTHTRARALASIASPQRNDQRRNAKCYTICTRLFVSLVLRVHMPDTKDVYVCVCAHWTGTGVPVQHIAGAGVP